MDTKEGSMEGAVPMVITLTDTERRKNGKESYVVYHIETKVTLPDDESEVESNDVWRRFSDFVTLRKHLEATYPAIVLAPLPPKAVTVGAKSPDFVEKRRIRLQMFLRHTYAHPILANDEEFRNFLAADDWQMKINKSLNLKIAPYAPMVKDAGMVAMETKAKGLQSALGNIIKYYNSINKKQIEMQATYTLTGKLYVELAELQTDLKDIVEHTNKLMNSIGTTLSTQVEDQEYVIAGLNEYELLMDSVCAVINTYATKEADCSSQRDLCAAKASDLQLLERAEGAPQGVMSLFQKKQTTEQNLQRLEKFRLSVEQEKKGLEMKEKELEALGAQCEHELRFFDCTKVKDLQGILLSLMRLHMKYLELDRTIWEDFRHALCTS